MSMKPPLCQGSGCSALAERHYLVTKEKRGLPNPFVTHEHLDLCLTHGKELKEKVSDVEEFPLGECGGPCPRLKALD